jgi:hypothetical protein
MTDSAREPDLADQAARPKEARVGEEGFVVQAFVVLLVADRRRDE